MQRRITYFKHLVTAPEANEWFDLAEEADRNQNVDADYTGIFSGLTVTQQGAPDLTVELGAGVGTDKQGARLEITSPQTVDLEFDSDGIPTAVLGGGNEKWITIYLRATRALSDERTDGNGNPVFYVQDEATEIVVTQGTEALIGAATKPPVDTSDIIVADVRIEQGTIQIVDSSPPVVAGGIDVETRRDFAIRATSTNLDIDAGTVVDAVDQLVTAISTNVDVIAGLDATDIAAAAAPPLSVGTVRTQLDELAAANTKVIMVPAVLAGDAVLGTGSVSYADSNKSFVASAAGTTILIPLTGVQVGDVIQSFEFFVVKNSGVGTSDGRLEIISSAAATTSSLFASTASGAGPQSALLDSGVDGGTFPYTVTATDAIFFNIQSADAGDKFLFVKVTLDRSVI